jgi:PAS domain S-box-containing protein
VVVIEYMLPNFWIKKYKFSRKVNRSIDLIPLPLFNWFPHKRKLIYLNEASLLILKKNNLLNEDFKRKVLNIPTALEYIYDEDRKVVEELLLLNDNGEGKEYSLDIRLKNNISKYFSIQVVPVYMNNGFKYASGIIKDVSAHHKAEEDLVDRTQIFENLVKWSNNGISIFDVSGCILEWNKAEENITGIKREDAVGQHIIDVISNSIVETVDKQNFLKGMEPLINDFYKPDINLHEARTMDMDIRHIDGSVKKISRTVFPIYGKHIMFGVISRDITDLKETEKELIEAKNMAEDANNAKKKFIANVSHEIRTPLSGIIGISDMLIENDPRNDQVDYLSVLRESALSMLNIVNDILDLSKIEAGRFSLTDKPFNLPELISRIIKLYSPAANSKGIKLRTHISEDTPQFLIGDSKRLGQVLMNLISNALKFTFFGSINISIKTESIKGNAVNLMFSVQDTGIGIPENQQSIIFNKHTQLKDEDSYNGSGLGLSISKTLVEMMGGEICVESESNAGSTFSFSLIFIISKVPVFKKEETKPDIKCFNSLKILLAEDTEINQIYLSYFLRKQGHSVKVVDNGQSVLDILEKEKFDLILMDIQMPVIDGITATRKIRSSCTEYSDIPIIALTAFAYKSDREVFLTEGMNGYVSKPVDYIKLNKIMAEILPDKILENKMEIQSAIGLDALEKRYRNSRDLLEKILDIFLKETPDKMLLLKEAISIENSIDARKISHSISNTTGTINAEKSHNLAKDIELSIINSDFTSAKMHYNALDTELVKVYSYISSTDYIKNINL